MIAHGNTLWRQSYQSVNWQSPINWRHPLNEGLVAWWLVNPFWTGGTTWRDLANRYHGTLTNMDPATDWEATTGGFGGLTTVSGSSQYISTPLVMSAADQANFTVMVAIENATYAAPSNIFASNRNGSTGWAFKGEQFFGTNKIGFTAFGVADYSSGLAPITDGVAGVSIVNGASASYYANGAMDSHAIGTIATSTGSLNIGRAPASEYSNATFLSVALLMRSLSNDEMAAWEAEHKQGYPNLLNRIPQPRYAPAAAPGGIDNTWPVLAHILGNC